MNDAIHEETYKGFKIQIVPDLDPMNPRIEFDNVGTMICFHKRYNLGDKHEYRHEDYAGWDELCDQLRQDFGKNPLILPLYLYDHSGITISTSPFSCPWDSGQVGFIVCSLKKAKEEWGMKGSLRNGWDSIATPVMIPLSNRYLRRTLREAATQYLEGEVKEYDQYLRGEVYGYRVTDPEGEETDSCWGYYGDYKYPLDEARSIIDWYIKNENKKKQERKKVEIRHRVPLEKRTK